MALNSIALDGDKTIASTISQTINGLTAGKAYKISFDWAAAQQHDQSGATTNQIIVSLGNSIAQTKVLAIGSRGFSGWQHESFNLVADNTSDTLTFLANGTPTGLPPMALLSGGLSLTAVATPESGTLALLGFGGLGLVAVARRRK